MIKRNKKGGMGGFTLIELLVVIAIIGILSSVVLASLNSARKKSRDARRISDLKQIQLALEMYADAHSGSYPIGADFNTAIGVLKTDGFMPQVPVDPLNDTDHKYLYAALVLGSGTSCTSYHLGAKLEEATTNPALKSDVDAASTEAVCTGSPANFDGTNDDINGIYDVKP